MARAHHPPSTRPLAVITGGARRVGRATTLALARAGCDVVVTYRGSRAEAHAVVREAVSLGADESVCRAVEVDLADLDATDALGRRLANDLPRVDVLVLNAASYDRTPLETLTPAQVMNAFTVNAASGAVLCARLAPRLTASAVPAGGAIVAMCDIHALGEHGLPRAREFLAYSMSKAAVSELVRTLARELAPLVRVNGVAPGVVAWPESGHESDAEAQARYLKRVPLARAGTPEDAAEVVRWLALDATYLTGEIVRVDGGRNLV